MLLVNQSANVFFFGDFNIHHKDWLTYSGGTDRPSKLLWISISNDLTQMVSFLLGSLNVTLIVLLISIYFFLLTLIFILQRLSLLEIFIILLSQFPLPFFFKVKTEWTILSLSYDYSRTDWDGVYDHLFHGRISAKLVSAIFCQIFDFHQMTALQKLWKMFFISSLKLFLLLRYSKFCISVLPSLSPCQPLL